MRIKTADTIEELNSLRAQKPTKKRIMHPNSLANLAPYPKGVSGNPGGKPKFDVAGHIARAVLEGNAEEAYKALAKALLKGNAYVFKELAERGYGKLKETHQIEHTYADLTDEQLNARLAKLEEEALERSRPN